MKRFLRVTIFAVAITALLLMALTMNFVSAESNVEAETNPSEQHIEELNHSEPTTSPTRIVYNDLGYDDGTVEYVIAGSAGSGFAVKFTPLSYPVDIRTARVCIPYEWPDHDHEMFAIYVYDDDGPGGQPGTCLGGPIHHTATNWYWNDVDLFGLGIRIESGDFYILYQQLTDYPDCEGLCLDVGPPLYGRSWYWDYLSGWSTFPDYNCMIRCVLDNPTVGSSWTFMVYLDGDNNLEWAAIDDFMEMSSVGSSSAVNIVVQFDRGGYDSSYGGWTTCKRYFVTPGMTPTVANAISDLGECNMADPNTLKNFVTWAMATYPADKYALILWNHGSGWKKFAPWDEQTGRGICWDNSHPGDYLTLQETEQALTGKYVDLLGYDACLMHMVEVAYQVMANAGVSVGSEEVEPNDGWPYDTILTGLTGAPTMTEYELGTVIVDRYMGSYGYSGSETQSAVTNALLPGLVTAVDNLAQALMTEINAGHVAGVQQARNAAAEINWDSDYVDLYHFAQKIPAYVPSATTQAQAVMSNVNTAAYAEAHGTSVPNDHGLSIYYPRNGGDYMASYDTTAFASDTLWNEFLKKYYAPTVGERTRVSYLKKGLYGDTNYDLYIYSAPTTIGQHGTLTASDYWSPDGNTVAVTAIDINGDDVDEIAYLKKGAYGAEDYDLWIYTAPTAIGQHGTLIATDYWAPEGNTVAITAIDINGDDIDEIAYLKKGAYGYTDYDLYIYTAPTTIGQAGTLIAADYWSPDGNTVGIAAIGGGNKIAYLKKGAYGYTDYDLYIYTAPTSIGQHCTLIASDYWAPDGNTVGITAIGGENEIAYLKKGAYGYTDYDLYVYTAPTSIGQHCTLIASDYWSPDGQTEGVSALG